MKAELMKAYLAKHHPEVEFVAPEIHPHPDAAMKTLTPLVTPDTVIVGSSLGGFWARLLAEQHHCKAALINPVVAPHTLMNVYRGTHINPYNGNQIVVDDAIIAAFKALDCEITAPQLLKLYAQLGDEVLDMHSACDFFHACAQHVEQGGNHHFIGFSDVIEDIVTFLGINKAKAKL